MAAVADVEQAPLIVPLIGLSLLFAAGVPWMLLIARRASFAFAIGSVVVLGFAGALATMWLTALLSLPLLATVIVVWSVAGVAGVVVCVRKRAGLRMPTNGRPGLAATAGALIWFAVLGAAQVVPGAARLSWAMQGDSANNVLFSRQIILDGGIRLGAGENPVPVPAGLLAIAMEFGRSSVDSADLLRHDVTAFAALWTLLIGLSAVMAGLLAGRVASAAGARSLVIGLSAAFGSAVPLAWFVTGYAAEFGFFNTHVSLIVLFAAVMVSLESSRPAEALAILTVAGTVLLAVWSPLIVVPGALGVLLFVRSFRALTRRGRDLVLVAAGVGQLVVYGGLVVLPGLFSSGEALGATGGAIGFSRALLPAVCLGAVAIAVAVERTRRSPILGMAIAVAAGSTLGLLALLAAAGGEWTYYPQKFAWLAAITPIVLIAGLTLPAVERILKGRGLPVAVVAMTVGVALFATTTQALSSGERRLHPFPWILAGEVMGEGDEVANQIFALSDPRNPRVLWKTGDPYESTIDFWLLQMQVDSVSDEFELRSAAYEIGAHTTTEELCQDLEFADDDTEILTADPDVVDEFPIYCPDSTATVTLVPALG